MSNDQLPAGMEAEFNQVAEWTADVLERLPPGEAIPPACRGSGNPAALEWLARHMQVRPEDRVLDVGGGIGGPGAWLQQNFGASVVIAEPMPQAAAGGHRLWGLASTAAWGDDLPYSDGSFDAVWALGVLDSAPQQAALLHELHRVVAPGGHLGVLAYLRAGDEPLQGEVPAGNDFSDAAGLVELLRSTGWLITDETDASSLAATPSTWKESADAVKGQVAAEHPDDEALKVATEQERQMAALLTSGAVVARLYVAVPA